jgi:hypothetical protein
MTEFDKALDWSAWFYALIRQRLALHPDGPDARHWRNWLFMVTQAQLAHPLASDSEDLLDDYRFWRERDPELKSLAVSDPEDLDR